MPYTVVLSSIPSQLTVGESVSWKWSDSNFPAGDWTLTYSFVNAKRRFQITALADGSDHLIEVPSSTAAGYVAGQYDWQAHVSDGTERYQVAAGVIEVVADFATKASGYDSRSHVKKVLDALEAAREGRADKTQLEQKVNNVEIRHLTPKEIREELDHCRAEYRRELVREGKVKSRRTIKARFR